MPAGLFAVTIPIMDWFSDARLPAPPDSYTAIAALLQSEEIVAHFSGTMPTGTLDR